MSYSLGYFPEYNATHLATQNCPSGLRLYQSGGVRACGRPFSGGSCVSVQFPSNGISYSQICGRVIGHSYETPDAVNSNIGSNHNNINSYYVDGISITRGSPRQHVWTLMATQHDTIVKGGIYNCPCTNGSTQVTQSFVGSHYFCEVLDIFRYASLVHPPPEPHNARESILQYVKLSNFLLNTGYLNTTVPGYIIYYTHAVETNKKIIYALELRQLHNVNLIKANRTVFTTCSLISTDPQLNIVSSGSATIVSVKPWDTRNITTR
uniref:Uncharacterized protein n=1 Tax=Amphimedon queenslandica TaxID=400682 RepID=A0A1X7TCE8_AMPQE